MKYLQFAVVVFVLYFLGYVLGPTITPALVKEQEQKKGLLKEVVYKGVVFPIDLAEYREGELPSEVEITSPVKISTENNEGEVRLVEGDVVTLLNRDGDQLIIEKPDSNVKGRVDPNVTNIYEVLAMLKSRELAAGEPVAGNPKPPATGPKPDPGPRPEPVVAVTPDPVPEPVVDPEPMPEPEPEPQPEPEPAPVAAELSDEQVIALMKKSIEGGAVKEFNLAQVKGWKATGDETIDGTSYQTGLAAYEAKTIFGVRPVQAKALIKDGKVERWVYAKSGMEIQ